jgi:glycosyltransferase involved in cell wall biosynthesis
MPASSKIIISVIIPCLNEQDYVSGILEDLTAQKDAPSFEVIVSDASSTDATVAVAKSFEHRLELKVVEAGRGVGRGRNAGADVARGEWLMFFDADVRIPKDFLKNFLAGTEKRGFDIASSLFRANSPKLVDRFGAQFFAWSGVLLQHRKNVLLGGFCILTKRSLHEKIHGFSTILQQSEDHDYAMRAIAAGGKFGYVTSASMLISVRRFVERGRWRMMQKYLRVYIYRLIHHGAVDPRETYDFGNHQPPEPGAMR